MSRSPFRCVSEAEGTGRASAWDMAWDGPGDASSSRELEEEANDSGNVNGEAREECIDDQPRYNRTRDQTCSRVPQPMPS